VEGKILHKHVDAPDQPANAQENTLGLETPVWCLPKTLGRENNYLKRVKNVKAVRVF